MRQGKRNGRWRAAAVVVAVVGCATSSCGVGVTSSSSESSTSTTVNKAATQLVPPALTAAGSLSVGVSNRPQRALPSLRAYDLALVRSLASTLGLRAQVVAMSPTDLVQAVARGSVDAAIFDLVDTPALDRVVDMVDYLEVVGSGTTSPKFGIATLRGSILTDAISSALDVVIADGNDGRLLTTAGLSNHAVGGATIDQSGA